jgi:exodeoxyribonuclease-3
MIKTFYSFNVNGIRSALSKGFAEWLITEQPDVVSIQETKAQPEQIDTALFDKLGYQTFMYSAEKKGYSGVAVLTKIKPEQVFYGIGINKFDTEGRLIRLDFNDISLINSYFPSGTTGEIRQEVKMAYLQSFKNYIDELKLTRPKIIVAGDFNICHKTIDISKPENKKNVSGFLPEEREWMSTFIASGFLDSFRMFNSNSNQYTWWSYRAGARAKNLGWRIDYHMISQELNTQIKNANINSEIYMSDHCPISIEIDF